MVLVPVTGGTSIAVGGIIGAGIGAVFGGVGLGFDGNYVGTSKAREYTGVCE
ncbi:hypothetical protein ACVIAJ_12400 [Acinetobacter johnsonii]|nr:hypothetical protein [Acinetobacter johnsonii]